MNGKMIALKSKYAIVDKETGETTDALLFGKNAYVDKGFVKVFIGFLSDIVQDKEVTMGPIKLLLWLINEKMDYNTLEVHFFYREAAGALDVSIRTIKYWGKILIEKGILQRTGNWKMGEYRLVDYSAVKGSMKKVIENGDSTGERRTFAES
jgi:hypothetical protein